MRFKPVGNNLFRSSRPKDAAWAKSRCEVIICLQSGFRNLLTNDAYERTFLADHGVKEYRLHCSDIWPPTPWHVEQFLRIVRESRERGEDVIVHCMSGVDRTGFMCAVYRMQVQGWSFDRAYQEWVSEGRHWWYDWWKHTLRTYENPNGQTP